MVIKRKMKIKPLIIGAIFLQLTAALVQTEIKLGLHILDLSNMCSPFHINCYANIT